MTKTYDRDYFDKWYRGENRVRSAAELRRKAALAVAAAEYFLGRSVRNVLDVGCGEGAWREPLIELRPQLRYRGVDSSDYAIEKFGRTRNIRKGTFASLGVKGTYDLVICSDVLHYVRDEEIAAGIGEFAARVGGLAFIEVLTREDFIVGDLDGLIRRPASWYRRTLDAAGLTHGAPYCWVAERVRDSAAALELA